MDKQTYIKQLKELKRILVEELPTEDLTDYARDNAYSCIDAAINYLEDNEDPNSDDW